MIACLLDWDWDRDYENSGRRGLGWSDGTLCGMGWDR